MLARVLMRSVRCVRGGSRAFASVKAFWFSVAVISGCFCMAIALVGGSRCVGSLKPRLGSSLVYVDPYMD